MRFILGRFKAAFFFNLGYSQDKWEKLETDIRTIAQTHEATEAQPSDYGRKFEVRGKLLSPGGATAVVTVWILLGNEDVPRFVTAYPEAK